MPGEGEGKGAWTPTIPRCKHGALSDVRELAYIHLDHALTRQLCCPAPSFAHHYCLGAFRTLCEARRATAAGACAEGRTLLGPRCSMQARVGTPRPPLPAPSRIHFRHQNATADKFGNKVHGGATDGASAGAWCLMPKCTVR